MSNYEFQVQTVCSSNSGAFTSSSTFSTLASPCGVSGGLNTTSITDNTATLNWTAVSGAASYKIQYRIVGTGTWIAATSASNSKSISALTASSTYEFQVQTVCSSNSSAYTTSSTFATAASPCTSLPYSLIASSITTSSALLDWHNASSSMGYNARYRIVGATTWTTVSTTTSSVTVNGLTAATNYEFQAQNICSSGYVSIFTSSYSFTTLAPPCSQASGLSSTSITDNAATLNWTAVSGAASYNIQYRVVGASTWISTTSLTNTKSISSLNSSSNYEFQVQTVCSSNSSSFSASSTFATLVPTCYTTNNLNATSIAATTATLSWNPVLSIAGYVVRYKKTSVSTWTNANVISNSYALSGLTSNTNYEFQVQTICTSGSSSFSTSFTFTTALSRLAANNMDDSNTAIQSSFTVYPNPQNAGENINLEINAQQKQELTVFLFDVLGKLILERKVFTNTDGYVLETLPTAGLSAGIYEMSIRSSQQFISKKLILK